MNGHTLKSVFQPIDVNRRFTTGVNAIVMIPRNGPVAVVKRYAPCSHKARTMSDDNPRY